MSEALKLAAKVARNSLYCQHCDSTPCSCEKVIIKELVLIAQAEALEVEAKYWLSSGDKMYKGVLVAQVLNVRAEELRSDAAAITKSDGGAE